MSRRVPVIFVLILAVLGISVARASHADGVHSKQRELDAVVQQAAQDHDADLARINELEAEVADLRRASDELRAKAAAATTAAETARREAAAARASRSRRLSTAVVHTVDGAQAWANQRFAIKVANCESADLQHWPYSDGTRYLGNAHLRDANGHYGKWQFDLGTWRSVGGTGNPADASEAEQDSRAYLLWKSRGWQPWECAGMV